jgi:hypothetical protein
MPKLITALRNYTDYITTIGKYPAVITKLAPSFSEGLFIQNGTDQSAYIHPAAPVFSLRVLTLYPPLKAIIAMQHRTIKLSHAAPLSCSGTLLDSCARVSHISIP